MPDQIPPAVLLAEERYEMFRTKWATCLSAQLSAPVVRALLCDVEQSYLALAAPQAPALDQEALAQPLSNYMIDADERVELDRLLAHLFLPTFTEREREIARLAARTALRAAPRAPAAISDEEASALLQTMDGSKWANAFCCVTGFPDEDWAMTWFCNAIMAGHDAARRTAPAEEVARLAVCDREARGGNEPVYSQSRDEIMRKEGERIAARCFAELPLDGNDSDGNESGDPADHIITCVRAAIERARAPAAPQETQ